jgi:PKD repeat protein
MMRRRALTACFLAGLLLTSMIGAGSVSAAGPPLPASMAAVGDSITQAASTGGSLGADAPQNSWSTGTSATVHSHYLRLLALGAPVSGQNHNRSVSGAKMVNLSAQMQQVVAISPQPDYLTVLMGGNDLCTDTVSQMTSVADFRTQFAAAMQTVSAGSPNTYVYVVSIPDVYQLWSLFRNNFWARLVWASAGICQSLLANPTSTKQADVERRAAVRQRNIDYNAVLAEVCLQYASRCRFDNNAVFNTAFTTSDVSADYFHPSIQGQAKLAAVSWAAGDTFGAAPPPPNQAPTADFSHACSYLACSFTDASTDDDGSIVAWSWQLGDGSTSSVSNPSHTYPTEGSYTVTLTVTDDGGATDVISRVIAVTAPPQPPPQGTMHVDALSGSSASGRGQTWTATVTISIADEAGSSVSGATVSGTWTGGSVATCTTGSGGTCTVELGGINSKKATSVTFTVSGATHATLRYDAATNLVSEILVSL